MNKRVRNTTHSLLALLLLAVLMGPLFLKPIHMLFAHHEIATQSYAIGHQHQFTSASGTRCAVCNFEFYTFTLQEKVCLPQAIIIYHDQPTHQVVSCDIRPFSHIFQLRAPPVCSC